MTDYSGCTKEDLLDVLKHIDKDSYPEKVEEIHRLLSQPCISNKSSLSRSSQSAKAGFKLNSKLLSVLVVYLILLSIIKLALIFTLWIDFKRRWEGVIVWSPLIGFLIIAYLNSLLNIYDESVRRKRKVDEE